MTEVVINGLIEGGKASTGAPFGPALGPLGVNIAGIVAEINEKTKSFEGIKIPVKVVVDPATKKYTIEIGSPPTSALILMEIKAQKGAKNKEESPGEITLEQVKKVADSKGARLYGDAKSKMTQVLGTCKSMNIKCEGKDPREVIKKINSGEIKV